MTALRIGDTVAYSRAFGKSVQLDREAMNARGTVLALDTFGGITLARLDWHGAGNPERVNVANLARVGTVAFAD